jgi:Lipocalin-like domain
MGNKLVGTWRYESWTAHGPTGAVATVGELATGLLIITADGWLSVHLMNGESVHITPDLNVRYLGYAGPYRMAGDRLVTAVEISSVPTWVGTEQVRDVELTGDVLMLAPPVAGGVRHELRWRRAG